MKVETEHVKKEIKIEDILLPKAELREHEVEEKIKEDLVDKNIKLKKYKLLLSFISGKKDMKKKLKKSTEWILTKGSNCIKENQKKNSPVIPWKTTIKKLSEDNSEIVKALPSQRLYHWDSFRHLTKSKKEISDDELEFVKVMQSH